MLACAHAVGEELCSEFVWAELAKEELITLVDGLNAYPLPADFLFRIPSTEWERANRWKASTIFQRQWEAYVSTAVAPSSPKRIKVEGVGINQVYVQPTPDASDAGQLIAYYYQSSSWVLPKQWQTGFAYTAGKRVSYDGRKYIAAGNGTSGATPPTHTTGSVSDGGVTWTYDATPQTRFLQDDDEPVFDAQLLSKGIEYKFLERQGLDYGKAEIDFQRYLTQVKSNLGGSGTIRAMRKANPFMAPGTLPEMNWFQ